jgi:hypothetical protein
LEGAILKKQRPAVTQSYCFPCRGLLLSLSFCCGVTILFLCFITPAGASDIALTWDANTEADLAGYRVYYKTGSTGPPYNGTGAAEGDSPVDVGNVTEFTLSGLTDEVTYFFAVTAYSSEGHESDYSNEVASSVAITSPEENFYINATDDAAYTITGVADAAYATVEVYAGDSLLGMVSADGERTWSLVADFTHYAEGEIILTARSDGLISDAVTGTYDRTAPTSEAIVADEGDGGIEIEWNAADECSGVASTRLWCKSPGGTWSDTGLQAQTGTAGSFSYTPADGEGTYSFATRATDAAGNVQDEPSGCGDCSMTLDATSSATATSSAAPTNENSGSGCFIGTAAGSVHQPL